MDKTSGDYFKGNLIILLESIIFDLENDNNPGNIDKRSFFEFLDIIEDLQKEIRTCVMTSEILEILN